jgi:hypothetical protein
MNIIFIFVLENRKLHGKESLENSYNFRGRSSERDSKGRIKSKKNVQCYYCKKYGHYKSECPNLKNKEEGDKLSSSFVVGVVEKKSEGSELVIAITISDGRLNDKWVLDNDCTFYISPKKGIGLLPMSQLIVVQS